MKSISRLLNVGRRPLSSVSKTGFALSTLPSEHFNTGLEEPLSVSMQQGYGYYPAQLGECIGDSDTTFRIVRKLGWGSYSNVWLGQDTGRENSFVALKILTANATRGCLTHQMDEQSFHERISSGVEPPHRQNAALASHSAVTHHPGTAHVSRFLGSFLARSTHGDHICFVFEVLGPNIANLRRVFGAPGLALPVVKAIAKQSLLALDYLHGICGIIHCDVKPGNILLQRTVDSLSSVAASLSTIDALNSAGQPTTQPLPVTRLPPNGLQVKIADFGHANWNDWKFHNQAVALPMQSPEMLLGLPNAMTSAVDIWALGCTIFELLVGQWLFKRKGGEPSGAERTHLFCMMELTQQTIPNNMLELTPRRSELFDDQGKVRNVIAERSQTMQDALRTYNVLREADLQSTAAFIVRCLRLDPSTRPTAGQLLVDPWFES